MPSFSVAFVGRYLLKLLLACLHLMHSLHISFGTKIWGSTSTIFCLIRRRRSLKLRWPNLWCHNHSILFSEVARYSCFRIFILILKVFFWDRFALITSLWSLSNTLRQLSSILMTKPFSSSWPRLNRLVFMSGTNNTSSMIGSFPSFPLNVTFPIPSAVNVIWSAKQTQLLDDSFILMNQSLFLVIWVVQPESKYHEKSLDDLLLVVAISNTNSESEPLSWAKFAWLLALFLAPSPCQHSFA